MELKPCPFCGSVDETHGYDCYFVIVMYPLVNGMQLKISNEAISKAWNTRATDPLLKEMAEAFEVIIRCLSHGLQDCKASITAKAILQKYHEQVGE